jgi:hypothetical protein
VREKEAAQLLVGGFTLLVVVLSIVVVVGSAYLHGGPKGLSQAGEEGVPSPPPPAAKVEAVPQPQGKATIPASIVSGKKFRPDYHSSS